MNSQKKIKEKAIKVLKFVFGDKARNLWFMAIVGGFFAANLRQNGRLSLIEDSYGIYQTDDDVEYYTDPSENLCGLMFRKYSEDNFTYYLKNGGFSKNQLKTEIDRLEKLPTLLKEIRENDLQALEIFDLSEDEKEKAVVRFTEACETTLGETAKSGFWWTVAIWSSFSWVGLNIASNFKE
tara:strand:+ start:77 stop:619 length:543 start_codon:yes stop_codon:yes gene_type:complete